MEQISNTKNGAFPHTSFNNLQMKDTQISFNMTNCLANSFLSQSLAPLNQTTSNVAFINCAYEAHIQVWLIMNKFTGSSNRSQFTTKC